MKIKIMGIIEILRRIWLHIFCKKDKSSESFSKKTNSIRRRTQLITVAHNCHILAYCQNSIPCLIGLGADHVIGVKVSVIDQVSPTTPIMSPFKVFNFILSNKELESMIC